MVRRVARCLRGQDVDVQILNFAASQPGDGIGHGGEQRKITGEFVLFGPDGKGMKQPLRAAVDERDFFLINDGRFTGNVPV